MSILCIWSFKHKIGISARCGASWFRRFHPAYENSFSELSHAVINSSWCCCMRTILSVVLQNKFPERTGVKNGHLTLGVSVEEPGLVPLYGTFCCFFCLMLSPGIIRVSYSIYRRTTVSRVIRSKIIPNAIYVIVTLYSCNIHKYDKL